MKNLLSLCFFLVLGVVAAQAQDGFTLTVDLTGVKKSEGFVRAGLYATDEKWTKDEGVIQGSQVRAVEGVSTITFKDIKPGTYAIAAMHDVDANGKMSYTFIGMPKEPYGFSNDAKATLSAPSFADCTFDVNGDTRISIKLNK